MELLLGAIAAASASTGPLEAKAKPPPPKQKAVKEPTSSAMPVTKTQQKDAGDISEAQLSPLVSVVYTSLGDALQKGLDDGAILPMEPATQLAHLVWEAKMTSWSSKREQRTVEGEPRAGSSALAPLSKLSTRLRDLFQAIAQLDVYPSGEHADAQRCTKKKRSQSTQGANHKNVKMHAAADLTSGASDMEPHDPAAVVRLANIEVGLTLAAMCFDANALQGAPLADLDESVGDAAAKFAGYHIRTTLASACSEQSPAKSKKRKMTLLGTAAPRLANAVARLLRSMHHALAAKRYPATPIARRAALLALHSLTAVAMSALEPAAAVYDAAELSGGLAALQAAAADLFAAMSGQAEESLQVTSVEELSSVFESTGSLQPRSYSRKHGVQVFTAAVLHAVCAATLPVRLGHPVAQGDVQELLSIAQQRFGLAEARAGSLVTGILQRLLLVSEKESEAWQALENFTHDLLSHAADLSWASAPFFLLAFVKGLIGIANASRNTDVTWTQREFAVRLLGQISPALCSQNTLVLKQAGQLQGQLELVHLQKSFPNLRLSNQIFELKGFSEALQQVIISHQDADLKSKAALLPPDAGSSKQGQLEGAAISASHSIYNASFLLCFWAVESHRPDVPAQSKGGRRKTAKRKAAKKQIQRSDVTGLETDTPSWALQTWHARASLGEPRVTQSSMEHRDGAAKCVTALYQRALHHEAVGLLARSRTAALEALLTLLKGSPLVHVRRQAVLGLSGACAADVQLVRFPCVAETIALSLQDDSALVRFAVVELISALSVSKEQDLLLQRVAELRALVKARLGDASPVVRRAAFRVVCSTIHFEDASLSTNSADLLRRIRHETPQIRTLVLGALERVFFSINAPSEKVLGHLLSLSAQPGVNGSCFRDLLKMHRSARENDIFMKSMQKLVSDSFARLLSSAEVDDPTPLAVFLEHVSAECPAAFHGHLSPLQLWLSTKDGCIHLHGAILAQQACKIFSNMIPSWTATASTSDRSRMGRILQQALSNLLESREIGVVRAATECFCVVAMYVGDCTAELLSHFNHGLNFLRETLEQRKILDGDAQMLVYRYACVVGTTLEFLNADALFEDPAGAEQFAFDLGELAVAAVWLLSNICLTGPVTLRSALVPCLGFLLRRHYALLCTNSGPLDVFQSGLQKNERTVACQANTVETLASLLTTLQQCAQTEAPSGCSSRRESTALVPAEVGQPSRAPSVSEAVQRLASLQADVLNLLCTAGAVTVGHALTALQAMHQLGVLHPSSTLPRLLAVSLAGSRHVAAASRRLLLQLMESNPVLLCSRLSFGLREAAAAASSNKAAVGDVLGQEWRFTVVREAYAEHMEGRQLREQFLDALLAEISAIAAGTSANFGGNGNSGRKAAEAVHLVELLFGTLAALPLRSEFELARLVRGAAQLLTLRAMPLLPDGDATEPPEASCGTWGICVSSVLLHALCQHWAGDHDLKRLLAAAPLDGWSDQPLSAGFFARRPAAVALLQSALREVMAASGNGQLMLKVLARHVPANSCLLRGPGTHQESKRSSTGSGRGRKRNSTGEEPEAPPPRPRKSATTVGKDREQSGQKKQRQSKCDLAASEGGA